MTAAAKLARERGAQQSLLRRLAAPIWPGRLAASVADATEERQHDQHDDEYE